MKQFGRNTTVKPTFLIMACLFSSLISVGAYNKTPSFEKFSISSQILSVEDRLARKTMLDQILQRHVVQEDETLYGISAHYYVSVDNLQRLNEISRPTRLKKGQMLYIPPFDPAIIPLQKYEIKPGDSIGSLQESYHLGREQLFQLNPGLNVPLVFGEIINLPIIKTLEHQKRGGFDSLIKPVRGFLSSRFGFRWGRMHYGLDLAAPTGAPVTAAASGQVAFTGWCGSYGLLIIIDHGQFRTYYGHLSRILVNRGFKVRQGFLIGRVGATGRAYGSHLHFEVERNGKKVNPYLFLKRPLNDS